MAKHMVKCPICNELFDANQESYIMLGRRYAHEKCQRNIEIKEQKIKSDKATLEAFIKELFSCDIIPDKINKQVKQYVEKFGFTYSGIYGTLVYWFKIRKSSLEKANGGIGIVPYVYDEARTYWKDIHDTREKNQDVTINISTSEVHINPPQAQPMKFRKKIFTFLEEEE